MIVAEKDRHEDEEQFVASENSHDASLKRGRVDNHESEEDEPLPKRVKRSSVENCVTFFSLIWLIMFIWRAISDFI